MTIHGENNKKRYLIHHGRIMRGCVADVGEWAPIREAIPTNDPVKPIGYGPHIGYAKAREDARRWAASGKMEMACRLLMEACRDAIASRGEIDADGVELACRHAEDAISDIDAAPDGYLGLQVEKIIALAKGKAA